MKLNMSHNPGIVAVSWVKCSSLSPSLMRKSVAGLPVALLTDAVRLPLCRVASLETTDEYSNNGRLEQSVLKFQSTQCPPLTGDIAFVATAASGEHFLLGARERPFPVVKVTRSAGAPGSDAAVFSVEVSAIGGKSAIPIAL